MQKSNHPNSGDTRYGIETFFKATGTYYFQFNGNDGIPILFSRGYPNQRSRSNGIKTFIRAATAEENYTMKQNKRGKHFFSLQTENGQEVGRSQMYDSEEEMEEKRAVLKSIEKEVPIFETVTISKEKEPAPVKNIKKEVSEEVPTEIVKNPPIVAKQEEAPPMPRYKFSIIYYPDSDVWSIKNDFSGDNKQLKTLDGQQLEGFIKSYLPASEPIPDPIKPAQPKPVIKSLPKPEKVGVQAVELHIQNYQGEKIMKFASSSTLDKIDVITKPGNEFLTQAFEAKVIAKSLDDNRMVQIGVINKQQFSGDRLAIPIWRANALRPGAYLFIVQIQQNPVEKLPVAYYGSQLLVLN